MPENGGSERLVASSYSELLEETYGQLRRLVTGEKPDISVSKLREATEALRGVRGKLNTYTGTDDIDMQTARSLDGRLSSQASVLFNPIKITTLDGNNENHIQREFVFGQTIKASTLDELIENTRTLASGSEGSRRPSAAEIKQLIDKWDETLQSAATITVSAQEAFPNVTWSFPYEIVQWTYRVQLSQMDEIRQSAREELATIQRLAGQGGKERLAGTFALEATTSRRGARYWTLAVFLCIVTGIALPAVVLNLDKVVFAGASGTAGFVVKALTGLPLFALAAYCGRIASQHRDMARHMTILTAQIDSVAAYVDDLPEKHKNDIKVMLGRRAYSDPGLPTRDKGKVGAIPDDARSIIEKASELAKEVAKKGDES